MINLPHYRASYDFLRMRDKEEDRHYNDRHYNDRHASFVMLRHLTENQASYVLAFIDLNLSMEYDVNPYPKESYTAKADAYTEEFLNTDSESLRNLAAIVSERVVCKPEY